MDLMTVIGAAGAVCTTGSLVPQLMKCWQTRSVEDLSLRMLLLRASALALWIAYGVLKPDYLLVLVNAVSLALLLGILFFKLRGHGDGAAKPA